MTYVTVTLEVIVEVNDDDYRDGEAADIVAHALASDDRIRLAINHTPRLLLET